MLCKRYYICLDLLFLQDGAPLHSDIYVRRYLDTKLMQHSIRSGGLIRWLAMSIDLTALYFLMWNYVKHYVISIQIQALFHSTERIEQLIAALSIRILKIV